MALDEDVYTDGSEKPTGQIRSFGKLTFLRVFDAGHMVSHYRKQGKVHDYQMEYGLELTFFLIDN